jgi:hypothetical protein
MSPTFDSFQNGAANLPDEISVSSCALRAHRMLNLLSDVQCFVNNAQAKTADYYRIDC